MAKSLRSKRMRKLRVIKRDRYAVKELKQLKSVLVNADKKDSGITELPVMPRRIRKKKVILEKSEEAENPIQESSSTTMEVDVQTRKYHPKKLTDEHGNYPVWMNQRKIQKHKARARKLGQKAVKKNNKRR